ncbi:MAG TPA: ABC transporter permease [Polyangiaceae bacterium LLY-WYZ-15_(1-7)]|nr:peptide ABC transporter permease [Myxococcales bacterium]HJK92505.1 ABC transporter permease [Polyangiaceae bacterium LLY-WYZ-15_(1-7)]HJL04568.1 ABC transporter permease [Polyangiaceae bacterium LLY-WYZ-15_(1-7)]HJL07350.1 ABC transporter permease [Polyangiaceae bacterium LLY-WYZ-15_(1-7)]HJL21216.1 ABC transporter permease [Polyangiaceae bacterium LLY-WYZ-15_(1-7)]
MMDPRAWRRFRKNKGALVGGILVVFVTLTAVFGPLLAPHDPNEQLRDVLLQDDGAPVGIGQVEGHPLGADSTGRDELSRLLYGGGVSMMVAYLATALAIFIGTLAGVTAGYFGGWIDFGWMRLVDLMLSLPFLLIAITIRRVIEEPQLWTLILLLSVLSWTTLGRVTRSKVMQIRELEYIQAARALGMGHLRILLRHVLPNALGPIIVLGTTLVARMIIFESALSFLGLGVEPPDATWGSMLNEGRQQMMSFPRLMLFPSMLIVMTVFGFNLLGEGLRDAFDPKD